MDTRPEENGGGRVMLLSGSGCIDSVMGYSWSSNNYPVDNIVLCPKPIPGWEKMMDCPVALFATFHLTDQNYGNMDMDSMVGIWPDGTIIHEMTHGHHIFSGTNLRASTFSLSLSFFFSGQ